MEALRLQLRRPASRYICASCLRTLQRHRAGLQNNDRIRHVRRAKSYIAQPGEQASPIAGFYAELLSTPRADIPVSATRTSATPPPPDELPKTEKEETLLKAQLVFGSRLAGPIDRRTAIEKASRNVAGIMVPPKPKEPDNCCMSGCVNCVWDVFRDEMEEWATKSAEARERLTAQRAASAAGEQTSSASMPGSVANSMDDDGGGSEANWDSGLAMSGQKGDIFEGIPVGIREFMKIEKQLKARQQEQSP